MYIEKLGISGYNARPVWLYCLVDYSAPVAQLDRVLGYEPSGQRFESSRARHFPFDIPQVDLGLYNTQ